MKTLVTGPIPATSGTPRQKSQAQAKLELASNDVVTDFEPLLSCWEALDGRVRLILSRHGQLIAQSKGAERFFDQGECLLFDSNLNLACAASLDKPVRRILAVAVGEVETLVLPKRSGGGHYIISATGIASGALALAMRDAGGAFATVFANLEEAFGLTHCEDLVIEKLMRGHVPQQIADELAISVHTVRAHLRHCYDKIQVSSREELWQRLAPYRLN